MWLLEYLSRRKCRSPRWDDFYWTKFHMKNFQWKKTWHNSRIMRIDAFIHFLLVIYIPHIRTPNEYNIYMYSNIVEYKFQLKSQSKSLHAAFDAYTHINNNLVSLVGMSWGSSCSSRMISTISNKENSFYRWTGANLYVKRDSIVILELWTLIKSHITTASSRISSVEQNQSLRRVLNKTLSLTLFGRNIQTVNSFKEAF